MASVAEKSRIIELLEAAKNISGLGSEAIAAATGLSKADVDNAKRLEGIKKPLVDWVLKQTIEAQDPWVRLRGVLLEVLPEDEAALAYSVLRKLKKADASLTYAQPSAHSDEAGGSAEPATAAGAADADVRTSDESARRARQRQLAKEALEDARFASTPTARGSKPGALPKPAGSRAEILPKPPASDRPAPEPATAASSPRGPRKPHPKKKR